ncbi:MAG: 30S ribosomal protein S2 [Ignavibacteriales bacterium]|nr:30S ribosomal protein S2 [Ignavibacteriales bacterium]
MIELTKLIEAGAHFGHLTRRWNPKMRPYIFMERNGIHLIDLKKTQRLLDEAAQEMTRVTSRGGRVLFVGTKRQAKGIVEAEARRSSMHWVTERWLGGMLTNFSTIRKSVKRLQQIEKWETDGTLDKLTKKEALFRTRERDKLKRVLEGIEHMNRLPNALFVVDVKREQIAVKEAVRLGIPVFALVDTNCDPDNIDFIVPGNDDAVKTIELVVKTIADAALEGAAKAKELKAERAAESERQKKIKERENEDKKKTSKPARRRGDAKPKESVKAEADAPKAKESVKAEAPKAEAPKAEAPKAEAPKAEAPKAEESAQADAPKAEAPKAEAPKTEAPKTEAEKKSDEEKSE